MLDAPLSNGLHINGNNDDDLDLIHNDAQSPPTSPSEAETKIDVEIDTVESDARHEPAPVLKLDAVADASQVPQVGTPADPDSIPVDVPKGTPPPPVGELLEDVRMAEEQDKHLPSNDADVQMTDVELPSGLTNGHTDESAAPSPASISPLPAVSLSETAVDSLAASSPYPINTISNEHVDDKPPPAKRARKFSDAEKASLANTGTPPPATPSPPNGHADLSTPLPPTFSVQQWKFCTSTVRILKKMKESAPFLLPVDPIALNIPHYPSIIKNPMDFSTIDRKLQSSNPSKPDPNLANPRYQHGEEFVADVRLIFNNCLTFNGPDHVVTAMGKRVEAVFDKQIKQMPPPDEPKAPLVKKLSTPPPPPQPAKKVLPQRRQSTTMPVIRRSDENVGRPKREIHPPPPKDLPYSDAPKKARKLKTGRNNLHIDQLKYCDKVLKDLHRKQHYPIANPFYEPVDYVAMNLPTYPKIVKRPMDLSTIRKKLDSGEYLTASKFYDDFKLMIRNCYAFNPPGNPVNTAGKSLDALFDEKWKNLPPLRTRDASDDEEEEDEVESEDEHARMIAAMESQIENMKSNLDTLKKRKSDKKEKRKDKREKAPIASTSKSTSKQAKAVPPPRKKGKKPVTDDDVLSFEQKKDLSDTISQLDGTKLERVIQIIHEGVPEIRDSTEEIELEIDQLPATVLTKLYNFVIRPTKNAAPKRSRTGKGTGTGGLKRKSMDEDVEAEKIRQLEARMRLFEGAAGGTNGTPAAADDSEHSSESSSGSESESDSE